MEKVEDSSSAGTNGFHRGHHHQLEQEEYEHELRQRLRRAQRSLLQRKYDETISICSNYFQSFQQRNCKDNMSEQSQTTNTAKSPAINNVILLKCQIRRPFIDVDQFQIHVTCCEESTEPTMLDQMVVIALQAFEEKEVEMQMKESSSSILWNNRKRQQSTQLWKLMIACLSNSSIGLEAFCVWMQFWQAQGLWMESFQWNVSVLVGQSKAACSDFNTQQIPSESASTITPQEELWIECLAHQLPRIQDHKLAVELMNLLEKILRNGHRQDAQSSDESPQTLDWWDKIEQELNKHLLAARMGDQPHIETIRSLQDSWVWGKFDFLQDRTTTNTSSALSRAPTSGLLSPTAMRAIQKAWKASLETINRLDQGDQSDDCHANEADNKAMVPTQNTSSPLSCHPQQNPKSSTWIDALVRFVRCKVQETIQFIQNDNKNPHFKSQVILSLTLTILSWRQRKNLKVLLSYILLPIRELLDALKAQ